MELLVLLALALAVVLLATSFAPKFEKAEKPAKEAKWMGAFAAFGKALEYVRANPAPAVVFLLAYLVLGFAEVQILGTEYTDLGSFLKLAALESAFGLIFLLALPVYALSLADRKHVSLAKFMSFNARKYLAILVAGVLYGLAIVGSLLLFIIPAIWVIAWFALYEMAVIDKGMGPVRALKESKRLLRNNKGKVWGLLGVSILFSALAGLFQMVPVFGDQLVMVVSQLVVIVSTVAASLLYRWAQRHTE